MSPHSTHHQRCTFAGLALVLALTSCTQPASTTRPNAGVTAGDTGGAAAVALGDITPGLHNLFAVAPGVYSGSGPEDAEAFDSLVSLGVKSVISVDGSLPYLELAHERGLRYAHIPIGYDGMAPEQEVTLARALRDMPGPVYIHCHHGKHRGPAAAAIAVIGLGRMTNAQAEAFMRDADTSESYPGLWACAAEAVPLTDAQLDAVSGDFPEAQHVSGLIDTMVAIDHTWDRIKLIRDAGWAAPADHPDLAPAAEAAMLADHFRMLAEDPETQAEGSEFVATMRVAADRAAALEASLARPSPDAAVSERVYLAMASSCSGCHNDWRN